MLLTWATQPFEYTLEPFRLPSPCTSSVSDRKTRNRKPRKKNREWQEGHNLVNLKESCWTTVVTVVVWLLNQPHKVSLRQEHFLSLPASAVSSAACPYSDDSSGSSRRLFLPIWRQRCSSCWCCLSSSPFHCQPLLLAARGSDQDFQEHTGPLGSH